jgi:hypothetical protein
VTQEQELLTFAGIWVHPKLFGGIHVAILSVLCFLSCLSSFCVLCLNVVRVSGLSIHVCLCSVSCVHMLSVSLDCQSLIVSSGFLNVYLNEPSCEFSAL